MIDKLLSQKYMRYLLLAIALLVSFTSSAQSVESVKNRLRERSLNGAMVTVTEDSATREAVAKVEAQRRNSEVSGFRIVIFSDNGQYAGDNANNILREFRSQYPYINSYLVYESPYFKVSVGDCLSMEEAQILMAKILPNYPKAFPRRENIKLESIKGAQAMPHIIVDSLNMDSVIE